MTPSENPAESSPDMAAALAELWQKFLPQLEERVAVLERAAAALSASRLSAELRTEAHSAAHKLAGSLGTFGVTAGTALAHEAESLFAPETSVEPSTAPRLRSIAAELRAALRRS